MSVLVRFAPSPTGLLHVGNARTAMLNYLFAKKHSGKFMLRIDDTDQTRSKPEYEAAIREDLAWLGVHFDIYDNQLARLANYAAAFEKLQASGLLYPCYESAEELERKRALQLARRKPPIYDRAALKLTKEERHAIEARGLKPHWRFKLSQSKVSWRDLIRGDIEIDTATLSDPVLVREDGAFLYTLPSVVDDVDYKITHIIRGEDHVTNTAVQIEIFRALGATEPNFAHHPLWIGAGGEALSKRIGSLSLRSLRAEGIEPLALASYLAKAGTSDAVELKPSFEILAAEFEFSKIGRAPAHFDPAELANLNTKLLHSLSYDAVAERLSALGIGGGEAFWDAVKPNLASLADARAFWAMVTGPLTPVIEDAAFAAKAAALLPPEPWDETAWPVWTKEVAAATGAKGRALYHPLRMALTASDHGPELKKLLPLIGRAKALARLKGETA